MNEFKIGDEVYDEVNFPNQKGIVDEISTIIEDKEPISVDFNGYWGYYTLDGVINDSSIPTLSYNPYTIEFKGFSQERPLTDAMKVCIKGDGGMEYGKKIIEYLEELGGKNVNQLKGYFQDYYFLNDNLSISTDQNIPEGYKEISLKKVYQVEGGSQYKILGTPRTIGELKEIINQYPNKTSFGFRNQPIQSLHEVTIGSETFVSFDLEDEYINPINYVGKKIVYKGSTFLILQQDKESVDILFDGKQEVIMISDIINGNYKIID